VRGSPVEEHPPDPKLLRASAAAARALSLALRACPSPELQGRDGRAASRRLLYVERRVAG